jgi:hypothetical protein
MSVFRAAADNGVAADSGTDDTAAAEWRFAGRSPRTAAGPRRADTDDALEAS